MLGGGMVYKANNERNCFVELLNILWFVCAEFSDPVEEVD